MNKVRQFRGGVLRSISSPLAWGLLDQAIVSASNFVITWTLARKLAVADYGLYVMAVGLVLALNSVQAALIVFPFSVRYVAASEAIWRSAILRCLLLTLVSGTVQFPIILIGCFFLGRLSLAWIVIPLLVMWQLQEVARRGMFQRGFYVRGLYADIVRYAFPAVLILWLPSHTLSFPLVLIVLDLASVASALSCAASFKNQSGDWISWSLLRKDLSESWRLGRSVVLFNGFGSALTQGCAWMLGKVAGLSAASDYQAINNVLGLTNPPLQGIAIVQEPAVARAFSESGTRIAIRSAAPYIAVVSAITLPILAFVTLAPSWTLLLFYGKTSPYSLLKSPLQLAALGQILTIGYQLASSVMACVRRQDVIWKIQMITSSACLALVVPAIRWRGLEGCFEVLIVFFAIRFMAMLHSLVRADRRDDLVYRPSRVIITNA